MPKTLPIHGTTVEALTVADLRELLAGLPDDGVLTYSVFDSDWGCTYHYALRGVTLKGRLDRTMIDGEAFKSEGKRFKQARGNAHPKDES